MPFLYSQGQLCFAPNSTLPDRTLSVALPAQNLVPYSKKKILAIGDSSLHTSLRVLCGLDQFSLGLLTLG